MKRGFWSGVIVAAISGGLIWAAGTLYDQWKEGRQKVIEYTVDPDAVVVNEDLLAAVSALKAGQQVATITLSNDGLADLADLEMQISDVIDSTGSGIVDFGVLSATGERVENPVLRRVDGHVSAEFKILRPDEKVVIWIANKGYSIFDVRNSQSGVYLDELDEYSISEDGLFYLFLYLGGLILSFVGGLIAAEALNQHVLRRIGLDPKEIAELYNKQLKSKD